MDIELVTYPDACMMTYIVLALAGLGGAYCGGLPPTACYYSACFCAVQVKDQSLGVIENGTFDFL